MFEFKHIKPFDRSYIENPGPMVVFATPGMLHAGLSLQVFKKWAPSEQNMVRMAYIVLGFLSTCLYVIFKNDPFRNGFKLVTLALVQSLCFFLVEVKLFQVIKYNFICVLFPNNKVLSDCFKHK